MMTTLALLRTEWRRLWMRPFAWMLAALTSAAMAWQLVLMLGPFLQRQDKLLASGANIGYTDLVLLPWLALFVVAMMLLAPLVTMSMLASERRNGNLPMLVACGLPPWRIVTGKYLAALGWMLTLLAIPLLMVLALAFSGTPDWGKLAAAALGLVLLAATVAAIGLACSACASHPALACAGALVISLALVLIDQAALADGPIQAVAQWLALPAHLRPMGRGLVDTADIAWFVIVTAVALGLAILRLRRDGERD